LKVVGQIVRDVGFLGSSVVQISVSFQFQAPLGYSLVELAANRSKNTDPADSRFHLQVRVFVYLASCLQSVLANQQL
jgi:hypothetical protein